MSQTAQNPKILAVDDDPRIHKIVDLYLRKNGYDVVCVPSGEAALESVKTTRPDLVLLDVMMPGLNGYEVCTRLLKDRETAWVPVIFATALGEERDKLKAFAAGAVDYLVKPFQKETLLASVAKHLETSRRWKEMARGPERPSAEEKAATTDFARFVRFLLDQLRKPPDALATVKPRSLYLRCEPLGIRPRDMAQHIADFLKLPYFGHINPQDVKMGVLPAAYSEANSVVAIGSATFDTTVVMSNPFDLQLQDILRQLQARGESFRLAVTDPENIAWIFHHGEAGAKPAVAQPQIQVVSKDPTEEEKAGAKDLAASAGEAPVVQLVNVLLANAIQAGASDIHIEPRETSVGIRYRIDGMLIEQNAVPKGLQPAVISRIKIMGTMDITERRVPQDGSVRVTCQGRPVDLRISTLPSRHGEKVVIRILDKSSISLDFDSLGYEEGPKKVLQESIRKPHGILLITGPTGSGKSTTLYTALQALNQPDTNIVTVEDPIEYEMHRITQVQVHPEAGLTFPLALRSILRQDPDIIMVGEIRDHETLDIAIKAALTGHLVLSTLHTNDAPSTVIRLRDMAEPYLVAASVQMIGAQRLLRRLCRSCKKPTEVAKEVLARYDVPPNAQFCAPVGCDECHGTGYKGRVAALEVMSVDDEMRRLIAGSKDVMAIQKHAVGSCGLVPIGQDAFLKAARGLTSMEEVIAVTG